MSKLLLSWPHSVSWFAPTVIQAIPIARIFHAFCYEWIGAVELAVRPLRHAALPLAQRPAVGGRPADLAGKNEANLATGAITLILPRRNRVVAGLTYLIVHDLFEQFVARAK